MFITISKNGIDIKPDKNTYFYNEGFVWFKGYFFMDDTYYSSKKAADYFNSFKSSEHLKTLIGKLNGVYTIIIANKTNKQLIIANDRFGFGHLFFAKQKHELSLSDGFWELATETGNHNIDEMAMYEMLRLRYVLRGHTIVQDIQEIEPSSIYTITFNQQINIDREEYWNFQYQPKSIPLYEASKKIHSCLNSIIRRYTQNVFHGSKTGLNLTGGIDSRYLLSLLLKNNHSPKDLSAYTFGTSHCEDIKISSQLTELCKLEHITHIFEEPFDDFFNKDTIDEILHKIGHSCFYFQGYGFSKILPFYKNIDYLLTGADGFYIGLCSNNKLFSINNSEELINYILEINATILDTKSIKKISKFNVCELEELLYKKIQNKVLSSNYDLISTFFDWTLKNRVGKYIVSIYEILNKNTTVLYPYYDYEFIDLMSSLPYNVLINQNAYVDSMYKHSFVEEYKDLANTPVENRKVHHNGENFILKRKNKNFFQKSISKLFAKPEHNYTYPIYKTFKHSKNDFYKMIRLLTKDESQYFNSVDIIKLIKKNSRNEMFFRYGLLAILSVYRLESTLTINQQFKTKS
ncbi:hypothetical protein GF376_00370 [Candidatus Peregrinibacteria bacterium]|nr:hypothetical protein [Candidatus Peregrinibacteria bacterium]